MKKYIIVVLLVLGAFCNINAKNDPPIFVLNSYHPEFKWTTYQVSGIRNALQHVDYSGNLYIEYLDTKNFDYSEMEPMYYDLLKRKYKGFDFKVVLCTDNDAFRFLQKFGNELFPKASFVFCGMNDLSDSSFVNKENFTGVFPEFEFGENIEIILKILPETKEIVSFFDSTDFGQLIYKEYSKSIKNFGNIKFTNIMNPTIDELVSKLSQLKKGQVIFQGELGKDRNGIVNNPSNITAIIKNVAKVPLFGNEIDMLRKGVIGGKLINPYFQSRIAGLLAFQLLKGKHPKDIKIIKNTSAHYFYDYKELKRNGINQSILPKMAVIINMPVSYWDKNKDILIKVSIGFIVLLILIFILSFNVIARKKAERLLLKSKEEIDKVLSSITDCVWSADIDSKNNIISSYFSPVIENIYGYPLEYFKDNVNRWQELIVQDDIHVLKSNYDKLINGVSNNAKFVFRVTTLDDKLKWIEQNITLTKTETGSLRFDGITKDITKSREQEETFLKYLKAIEQSPISVIITNTQGLIEYVNPHFEKISGYTFEEVKYKNPKILKTNYLKDETYKELWKTISSGKEWKGEFNNKKKNGELYWELASISPIKNDEGEITHYLAVKEDITHIKCVEHELIEAKEKAEKADKLKDEFLAQMSHEIRTPINAILSFAGLLKDELEDKIEDDLKTCFAIMTRAGKRIIRTIDLILNMAEMKTGYFQPVFVEIDIDSKISEAIQYDFKQSASDKKLYLNYNYKSKSKTIIADEYTFDEIIKNLVDNAIKYTFTGGIDVNVFDFEDNKLAVEVKDTGIGISDEYIPNLFEPFSQEEQGYTRKFEGNGLGLALIKKYTDLNDAKIEVKSKKGEGTTFVVYFNKNHKNIV